jgi:hypothetical protein
MIVAATGHAVRVNCDRLQAAVRTPPDNTGVVDLFTSMLDSLAAIATRRR